MVALLFKFVVATDLVATDNIIKTAILMATMFLMITSIGMVMLMLLIVSTMSMIKYSESTIYQAGG